MKTIQIRFFKDIYSDNTIYLFSYISSSVLFSIKIKVNHMHACKLNNNNNPVKTPLNQYLITYIFSCEFKKQKQMNE